MTFVVEDKEVEDEISDTEPYFAEGAGIVVEGVVIFDVAFVVLGVVPFVVLGFLLFVVLVVDSFVVEEL